MGLLDGVLGSVLGNVMGGNKAQGSGNPLMDLALQMITSKMSGGAAGGAQGSNVASGAGGLGGLLEQLTKGGLGEQAASWVSTGENMPVSGEQISGALGQDQIADIARQLGMSNGDVSGGLAQILPDVINKVTPNGQVPSQDMLQNILAGFFKK